MVKKFVAKLLIITLLSIQLTGIVYSDNSKVVVNSFIENESKFEEYAVAMKEQDYIDSFIIKYKNTGLISKKFSQIMGRTVENAIETAYDSSIDEKYEIRKKSSQQEKLILEAKSNKTVDEIRLNNWKDGYGIISLPESVDPETFINEIQERANDIEYIQPNYKLVLSDFDGETENNGSDEDELSEDDEELTNDESQDDISEELSEFDDNEPEDENNNNTTIDLNRLLHDRDYNITSANAIATGSGIKIAVIDGGVDVNNSVYGSKIDAAWDIINNCPMTFDGSNVSDYYHGTHITGVINSVAPDADLILIKVFSSGGAYTSDIIDAIEYAENAGATIVNCSWGCTDNNLALKSAMDDSEMLFVCAAGNSRLDLNETKIYPACYDLDNIISVSSINDDMGLSYFSDYSTDYVDIAAWGRDVISTFPNNEYNKMTGTSVSAAFVSGSAALAAELNNEDIKLQVLNTADKLYNLSDTVSSGRKLNPYNIVNNIVSNEYIEIEYENDFDVHGYERTPAENWELFCSLDNIQVACGDYHTLVLKEDHTVWSWGANTYGMLGDGNNPRTDNYKPQQVIGLTNIKQIAAGNMHNLALDYEGNVYSWGWDFTGSLGRPVQNDNDVPIEVSGFPDDVGKISANFFSNMAIIDKKDDTGIYDGTVYAWGYNAVGCLGTGYTDLNINVPRQVQNVTNAKDIYVGIDSHAILVGNNTDRMVLFCGSNTFNQFGTDDLSLYTAFTSTNSNINDVTDVAIGKKYILLLKSDGTVLGSGCNYYTNNETDYCMNNTTFTQISGLSNIKNIESGEYHNLAIRDDGTVYTWGGNTYGQIGDGTTTNCAVPTEISSLPEIVFADLGDDYCMAVDTEGTVWCWGNNEYGQLADGSYPIRKSPTMIEQMNYGGIKKISAGYDHTLILYNNGNVTSFGSNEYGQIGTGIDEKYSSQQLLSTLNYIDDIAAGSDFNIALRRENSDLGRNQAVYVWGNNAFGQFGNGSAVGSSYPLDVSQNFPSNIVSVAAGYNHLLILTSGGQVYACGSNEYGQLGDGTTTNRNVPVLVQGINYISSISCGNGFSMALGTDGTVYTWGRNDYGQLGTGNTTDCSTPYPALTPNPSATPAPSASPEIIKIAAGGYHSLALNRDGTVCAWGCNSNGQIGCGTQTDVPTPTQIPSLTNIIDISAGECHSGAVKSAYNVWTWGDNTYGQGGGNNNSCNTTPINVNQTSWSYSSIASGGNHNFAIRSDGSLFAWGNNEYGQLGDDRAFIRTTPCNITDDTQGNSLSNAHNISTDKTMYGYINGVMDEDWYLFRPKTSGVYSFNLESDRTGFNAIIYQNNNMLAMSWADRYLEKNQTYYIEIVNRTIDYYDTVGYNFTISLESFDVNIPVDSTTSISDSLDYTNTNDEFSFTVANSSTYMLNATAVLDNDIRRVKMKIYDVSDNLLASFYSNSNNTYLTMQSGQYTLTVEPAMYSNARSDYTLTFKNIGSQNKLRTARYGHSMLAKDNQVYMIGGECGPNTSINNTEQYDMSTKYITQTHNLSLPFGHSMVYDDENAYVFGVASNGASELSVYDLDDGTRTTLATASPTPIYYAGMAISDNDIYIVGGFDGSSCKDSVLKYANNTLTEVFQLNNSMKDPQVFVYGDNLYVAGGMNGNTCYNTVYARENNQWVSKDSIDYTIKYMRGKFYNGYFICAVTDANDNVDLLKYNPSTDNWMTIKDNFINNNDHTIKDYAFDICNDVIIISGGLKSNNTAVSDIYTYYYMSGIQSFYQNVPIRTIGYEFEQLNNEGKNIEHTPKILEMNARVIDSSKGEYELYLTADDYVCTPGENVFFFWNSKEGVFKEVEGYNDYSHVIFKADPNTGNRQVKVIVGIGDGKGLVARRSFFLNGNNDTE